MNRYYNILTYIIMSRAHKIEEAEGLKEVGEKIYNFVDAIVFGIRKGIPPNFKKILEKYGNNKIVGIRLVREPVTKAITEIINVISLGEFKQNIKKAKYDDVYHLFCFIKLDNNVVLRLEKNQVISLKVINSYDAKDHIDINLKGKKITFGELIRKSVKRDGDEFFVYHAAKANCQIFLNNILYANNLNSPEYTKFILQDAYALIKKDGFFDKISKKLTDAANLADIVVQGRGLGSDIYKEYRQIYMGRPEKDLKEINKLFIELQKSNDKLDDDLYYMACALVDACLSKKIISDDKYIRFNELLEKKYR
jgi:hypothetical protein